MVLRRDMRVGMFARTLFLVFLSMEGSMSDMATLNTVSAMADPAARTFAVRKERIEALEVSGALQTDAKLRDSDWFFQRAFRGEATDDEYGAATSFKRSNALSARDKCSVCAYHMGYFQCLQEKLCSITSIQDDLCAESASCALFDKFMKSYGCVKGYGMAVPFYAFHVSEGTKSLAAATNDPCSKCQDGYYQDQDGFVGTCKKCNECAEGSVCKPTENCAAVGVDITNNTNITANEAKSRAVELVQSRRPCPSGHGQDQDAQEDLVCVECKAGTFADTSKGSAVCTACPPGTYQDDPASDSCKGCPAGTFSGDDGALACTLCSAGLFAAVEGTIQCTECPSGKYVSDDGATECIGCGKHAGTEGQTGSQSLEDCSCETGYLGSVQRGCVGCPAGTFGSEAGCSPCTDGTYQDQQGGTECKACAAGSYTDASESSSVCTACPLATYSGLPGISSSSQCVACGSGSYTNAPAGSTTCEMCGQGKYSTDGGPSCSECGAGSFTDSKEGSTTCTGCPLGTFHQSRQPIWSASHCVLCDAGSHTGSPAGASTCVACAEGTWVADDGVSECQLCAVGSYTDARSGSLQCSPCDQGTYSSDRDRSKCEPCGRGTYMPSEGQESCTSCAAGSYTDAMTGSFTCKACEPGRYSSQVGISLSTQCVPCGPGQFSQSPGQVKCTMCPPGTYAFGKLSTRCSPCIQGQYASEAGQPECTHCEQGTYTATLSAAHSSQCIACPQHRSVTSPEVDDALAELCPDSFVLPPKPMVAAGSIEGFASPAAEIPTAPGLPPGASGAFNVGAPDELPTDTPTPTSTPEPTPTSTPEPTPTSTPTPTAASISPSPSASSSFTPSPSVSSSVVNAEALAAVRRSMLEKRRREKAQREQERATRVAMIPKKEQAALTDDASTDSAECTNSTNGTNCARSRKGKLQSTYMESQGTDVTSTPEPTPIPVDPQSRCNVISLWTNTNCNKNPVDQATIIMAMISILVVLGVLYNMNNEKYATRAGRDRASIKHRDPRISDTNARVKAEITFFSMISLAAANYALWDANLEQKAPSNVASNAQVNTGKNTQVGLACSTVAIICAVLAAETWMFREKPTPLQMKPSSEEDDVPEDAVEQQKTAKSKSQDTLSGGNGRQGLEKSVPGSV